jgi:hypothetical protein
MTKQLREQVDGDSEFLKEPTEISEWLNSLGPDKLEKLVTALQTHDQEKIKGLTGLTEEQAAATLKVWKEKAARLARKYPDLDSLHKNGH